MGRNRSAALVSIRKVFEGRRLPTYVLVFAGAIVAQLVFDALLPPTLAENTSSDFFGLYLPAAENLHAGRGLTVGGVPATYGGPGYSVVLAGSFYAADLLGLSHEGAVDGVRFLSVGLGAVLLVALFERLFPWRTAVLATTLWVLFPLNLFLGKQPNSELPFRVLLYGALLAYVVGVQRRRPALVAAAGALVGLATLIRPAALWLGLVLALALSVGAARRSDRSLLRLAGLLVLANVAVLIPHQLWLASHSEGFALVSTNGAASAVDGLTIGTDADEEPVGGFSAGAVAIMQRATDSRPELTTYSDVVAFVSDASTRDPLGFADLVVVKAVQSWYSSESGTGDALSALLQVATLAAAGFGIWSTRRSGRLSALVATVTLAVPMYFWLMAVSVLPLARYMVPSEALLFPFVAITLEQFVGSVRARRAPIDHA